MSSCERVDLSLIETAHYRCRNGVDLAITPELFADAEAWCHVGYQTGDPNNCNIFTATDLG